MKNSLLWVVGVVLAVASPPAHAAGPILVDTDSTGEAVIWQNGEIHYNLESGEEATLGTLTNAEAVEMVDTLFDDWKNITIHGGSTVSITLTEGNSLGVVDTADLDDHFTYCPADEDCPDENSPFVVGSARTGESPILFDEDGSMTDAVQGSGASRSILGFAGPRVVERSGGILYITEGQGILNGRFIDGVDTSSDPEVTIEEFRGAIFHELGHFMGLDHTQVNLASAVQYLNDDTSEAEAIPTMFPLFIAGEAQATPHFDDKISLSTLYPSAEFTDSFCRLEGVAYRADEATELQGVNVIVSSEADPLNESESFVSGSLYAGSGSDCSATVGDFVLPGLMPGTAYTLSFEKLSQVFTGGSSVEPCDPPQTGFTGDIKPGTYSCATGGETITAGTESDTLVVTNKEASSGDDTSNTTAASGGCGLLP